jgi:phospholipase/carboxylesterase
MTRIAFLQRVDSSGAGMRHSAQSLDLKGAVYFPDGTQPFDMGPGRQWFSARASPKPTAQTAWR